MSFSVATTVIILLICITKAFTACPNCDKVVPSGEICLTGSLGEQICIVRSNVVLYNADALVNAANEQLSDAGGVAKEFVQCGGQQVQTYASGIIAKNGHLQVSETAVQPAGCLNATDIINVVGPQARQWSVDEGNYRLRMAVFNVLRSARMRCADHVALPLVSAGIYGFGAKRSSEVLMEAVFDFYLYWYNTEHGKHSDADIAAGVASTRFLPPVDCPNKRLSPSRVTLVGYWKARNDIDMTELNLALSTLEGRMAKLRATHGPGTFDASMASTTPHFTTAKKTTQPPRPMTTKHTGTGGVPEPTSGTCLHMSCGVLVVLLIIAVIIIGICVAYALRVHRKVTGYEEL